MHLVGLTALFLFAFGAFSVVGGFVGFVKARSKASLIAGGVSGALLVIAGVRCLVIGVPPTLGLVLGLVVSAALAARFVPAFRKSRAVMPAGLMAGLSLVGVTLTIAALATP